MASKAYSNIIYFFKINRFSRSKDKTEHRKKQNPSQIKNKKLINKLNSKNLSIKRYKSNRKHQSKAILI